MTNILMLTNDVYQLDRRILQEATSLAKTGFQVTIAYMDMGLVLPEELPAGGPTSGGQKCTHKRKGKGEHRVFDFYHS